jgi:hypothetical protein
MPEARDLAQVAQTAASSPRGAIVMTHEKQKGAAKVARALGKQNRAVIPSSLWND